MTSLSTIIRWALYGAVRYVLYWIPGFLPPAVGIDTPTAWWSYADSWEWSRAGANNGRPDEIWLNAWFRMTVGELSKGAVATAATFTRNLRDRLRTVIGYIRPAFQSTGEWLSYLQGVIGYIIPTWTSTIGTGLNWLRERLPATIRYGWGTWGDLWETIRSSVRSWARARYDEARQWASNAFDWVVWFGDALQRWRDRVAGWIDNFRANPYGYVAGLLGEGWSWLLGFYSNAREIVIGWLGPNWPRLRTFARDCVRFYYNLWSSGANELSAIVEDPQEWLRDKVERMLLYYW